MECSNSEPAAAAMKAEAVAQLHVFLVGEVDA
jgi:hypothetical protein